jgi:peroxiredoxin Q/BCP
MKLPANKGLLKTVFGVLLMFSWLGVAAAVKVGDAAPEFELRDQDGQLHRLGDYEGRWLVLYFYPKDDTPGCTTEACEFRDDVYQLKKMDVALLGVSLDSTESHRKFAQKYHLPFPLLADVDGRVADAYGSLFSLGPLKFAKRHSFIIDPQGRLARVYRDVNPKTHSDQVVTALRNMGAGS